MHGNLMNMYTVHMEIKLSEFSSLELTIATCLKQVRLSIGLETPVGTG